MPNAPNLFAAVVLVVADRVARKALAPDRDRLAHRALVDAGLADRLSTGDALGAPHVHAG